MLLVLTLVYLFHGFQTRAAPFTSLLAAESSSNATVLSTPACICPADQRSIWDMLFEENVAKGVLSPERFSELLTAGKIEFPAITVEEIVDRSKSDGFSKTIALGQTLWFVAQCLARIAQHLDLTLVELLTLSLAVLNGVMYFLWWNKSLDVRCPVRVNLLDKSNESNEPLEPIEPVMTKLSSLDRYGEFS